MGSAKMMPINTSSWVNNSKRMQKKVNLAKRCSSDEVTQKYRAQAYH